MRLLSKSLGGRLLRACAALALPAALALSFSPSGYAGTRCDVSVGGKATVAGFLRFEVLNPTLAAGCFACIPIKKCQSPRRTKNQLVTALTPCDGCVIASTGFKSFVVACPGSGMTLRACAVASCPGAPCLANQALPQIIGGQTLSNTCIPF